MLPIALIAGLSFMPLAWRINPAVDVNIAIAIMKTNMVTVEEPQRLSASNRRRDIDSFRISTAL
jgi:hypothetical protein